jgi:hypothetical protein
MTQHILMIWMATAVAAFTGLVGCTTKGATSAAAAPRAVQVARARMALVDNILRAVGFADAEGRGASGMDDTDRAR